MPLAYRLNGPGDVAGELRRIVEEQIDRGVAEIDDPALDDAATIHQVRKRCKKIRAVLRLARGPLDRNGAYARENAWYRDLAAGLSSLRDADVLIETHDGLVAEFKNPDIKQCGALIRRWLLERRERLAAGEEAPGEKLSTARELLLQGRSRAPDWSGRLRGFKSLEPGLRISYRRGRRAMTAAYRSLAAEDFHQWRKQAKYHWYACRLLREPWPAAMDARRRELKRLSELLGGEHDLSVYRQLLASEAGAVVEARGLNEILAAIDQRRTRLRRAARPPGLRLYAEKPAALSARFAGYWKAWRTELK